MRWLMLIYIAMIAYLVVLFALSNNRSNAEIVKWSFFSFLMLHVLIDLYLASKGERK